MAHMPSPSVRSSRRWCLVAWLLIFTLVTTGFTPGINSLTDAHTYVVATNTDAITFDPALAYDLSSDEVVQNVYETLVFYDGAAADTFVPQLAESYTLSGDGLTWTFNLRPGVTFHNGAALTATDVAYSFQRGLLQGGSSSPQWLLSELFFGVGITDVSLLVDPNGSLIDNRAALSAWDSADLLAACGQVRAAIVANEVAGTVTMHLAQPWGPFLATIAGTWGSIMNKDWTIANGGWDGTCNTWQNYYAMNAAEDPFTALTNGTGPFKLDHWTHGTEIVLTRNDSYWGTPAQLARVEIQIVPDDTARFAMLQSGAAEEIRPIGDRVAADALVGEDCLWNVDTAQYDCSVVDAAKSLRRYAGRPGISQNAGLMNFDVDVNSPYIGSGLLDGSGIPTDFFSDVHIRKAFNYCFDWNTYGQTLYGGEYVQEVTLPLEGMPGYDLNAPHYSFDLGKCADEFGLADVDQDGIPSASDTNDVTQVGFYLQIPYNQGSLLRQTVAEILMTNLVQVNSKFIVDIVSVTWTDYQAAQDAGQMPVMTGGWLEDIHDPHNWYQPYLVGMYANRMRLPDTLKTQFSVLIDQGVAVTDYAARHAIYQQLNQLVYDNTPIIMLGGAMDHNFIQRRVLGRLLNQSFPGNYYSTISLDTRNLAGSLGAKAAGATITYTGGSTITDGAGNYSFSIPLGWSGTVTPSKIGYSFVPTSRDYVNITSDRLSETYTATQNEYALTITSDHGTVTKIPNQTTYHEGDVVQLTAVPATSWLFSSWSGALTGSVNPASITIHGNTAVTANYLALSLLTVKSTGTQDGWILELSEKSNKGGTLDAKATTLRLGDDNLKKQYLGLLSFSTGAGLPDGAIITKVMLKVKKQGVTGGGDPTKAFQGFVADVKTGFFGTAALQIGDFQAKATKVYGPFKPALVSGWYSIDLTAGKDYINKLSTASGLTQIRLRFKLDDNNNAVANYLSLYSGNAPAASRPQLIIEYYVP